MNLWKPIALASIAGLVLSLGIQVARADGACRGQHHMQEATRLLHGAIDELEKAEHNKGGWRENALQAARNALRETDRGCEFDDRHR